LPDNTSSLSDHDHLPQIRHNLSGACPITKALTPTDQHRLTHDAANNTDGASRVQKADPARAYLSADSLKIPHARCKRHKDCVPSRLRHALHQASYVSPRGLGRPSRRTPTHGLASARLSHSDRLPTPQQASKANGEFHHTVQDCHEHLPSPATQSPEHWSRVAILNPRPRINAHRLQMRDLRRFRSYANILTCARVCHLCFFEEREYYPLTASEAARRFGVSRGSFASLPSLESIPRTYARRQTPCKTRLTLYDPESARRMSIEHHGSSQAMEAHVAEHTQKALEAYQQRLALHSQSGYQGPRPRAPPRAGLEDGSTHEARPYMAIVRIPWVSRLTRTVTAVEWGFHCRACSKQNNRPLGQHWLRKFCAETFEEHLAECGPIDWAEGRGYFHRTEGMLGGVLSS
jgi:hypothetical protein